MKRLLTLLTACAALVAAGCGGDDNESAGSNPPAQGDTSTQESSGGSSASSGEVEIKMQNFQFAPKSATVKVGQKVKWVNEDTAEHDAVDKKTGQFKSELFPKGESYEFTAKKAGTISYVCTVHPGMTGTLTVTK